MGKAQRNRTVKYVVALSFLKCTNEFSLNFDSLN